MATKIEYFNKLLSLFQEYIEEQDLWKEADLRDKILEYVGYEKNEQAERALNRVKTLEKCLSMINHALLDGLTIEKSDPIHNQVKKLLNP